jgi:UDP-N-acetylmuramate dehydrogenase
MNADLKRLAKELAELGPVLTNEPLSRHVTFGVGGPADLFFKARDRQALKDSYLAAARFSLPCFILGAGSNVLVGDGGIRGLAIENEASLVDGPRAAEDHNAGLVDVDSGVSFAALARRMCRAGWGGIEWAVGIPGSLGGAVVHNAGAYEGCLADVLVTAEVCQRDGVSRMLGAPDLEFSYRNSALASGVIADALVVWARLLLKRQAAVDLLERVATYDRERTTAQPPGRNCGSVFKNPPGHSAWELVDAVGLRGERIGGAQISKKHANFILNLGDARAADVKALIDLAERRVRERFGVVLETEVNLIGEGF